MDQELVRRIETNPHYIQLGRDRTRFGWILAVTMLIVYYGVILLIAFNKEALSIPIGNGVTKSGIPMSHDLYATVFKHGNATSANELKVSRNHHGGAGDRRGGARHRV